MPSLSSITAAYALACLISGVARELMPRPDSRKVIKTISGLYILLVLVHEARGLAGMQPDFSMPSFSAEPASTTFQQDVIDQTAAQLEQNCNTAIAEQGLHASVHFFLEEKDGTAFISQADVAAPSDLSEAEKQEIRDILQDYAPAGILFEREDSAV